MWDNDWIKGEDYPEWGNTDVYKKTIAGGYLLSGETPRAAYMRVASSVARRLYKPELAGVFFDYIWKGWLCLASPVLSNTGTDRGLPISCFGIDVGDSIQIEHHDFLDWLDIREPKGDVNRQSLNLHQCAVVGDKFMRKLEQGDAGARDRWSKLLRKRKATGEPYILFKGNTNKANPQAYKTNGLKVHMTNICSEITLHTDENHSFVCCLSSLNLAKYEEWKDTNLIYDAIWFLDGVMEEFIQRAKGLRGFENAIRSAQRGRALGLGVLGWHTYLQEKGLPFEGLLAQFETRKIFSQFKIESERASMALAETYGEPLWCVGTGLRNTHLRAIAPTVSNSKLSGNISPGIEPWAANVFTEQSAKGTFIRKNPTLVKLLKKHKLNTNEIWDKILADGGSVQDISELDNIQMAHEVTAKEVFKTFKEINQLELVNQAGIRQQYVDQSDMYK
jgi:ribonucleoside-diphosphate reductase alpha chain